MVKLASVVSKVFVRSPYNYDRDAVSRETAFRSDEESMTQQSFKDECDINTIVRRFGVTGVLPQGAALPRYGMFEGIFDFHSAMNAVAEAHEAFDALPADIRKKFENDPGKFVEFCSNKDNLPELRKLGLAKPEVIPDNVPVPDVPAKEKANAGNSTSGVVKGAKASAGSAESSGGE